MAAAAPAAFGSTAFWAGAGTAGTAITASQVMTGLSVLSTGLGAIQAYNQGQYQSAMYKLQGDMTLAKSERDAVNAEIQANEVLRKLRQTNAAAIARGFAGGVSGFDGSAKLVQDINEKFAGRDFKNLQVAAKEKRSFGQIQSMMFEEAADAAASSSIFDSLTKVATGAMTAYALMPGGGAVAAGGWDPATQSFKTGPQSNIGPNYG